MNKEEKSRYLREYRQKNREKLSQWRKQYYLEHKEEIADKTKKYQREYRQALKKDILSHYSNEDEPVCTWCGEDWLDCLTLDHIEGGGYKHRKNLKKEFYRWLRNQGYPKGYQVLCMNCQLVKRKLNREYRGTE